MGLGILYSLAFLGVPFVLILLFTKSILSFLYALRIPKLLLILLLLVPLIIFEEHINCDAYQCANVFVPPTFFFVLAFILILLAVSRIIPIKNVFFKTAFLALCGVSFEFFFGVAHAQLHELVSTQPAGLVIILLWTGISYAFILFVPLLILNSTRSP